MDQLTALRSILDVRWDAPYRFAASLVALVAIIGAATSRTPLEALGALSTWGGWDDATTSLTAAQTWLSVRPLVLILPGAVFLVIGAAFAYRQGRGASTALIGSALLVQAGGWWAIAPLAVLVVVLLVWLVFRLFARRVFNVLDDPTRHVGSAVFALVGALFWVVLGPLSWMVRRG